MPFSVCRCASVCRLKFVGTEIAHLTSAADNKKNSHYGKTETERGHKKKVCNKFTPAEHFRQQKYFLADCLCACILIRVCSTVATTAARSAQPSYRVLAANGINWAYENFKLNKYKWRSNERTNERKNNGRNSDETLKETGKRWKNAL